LVKITQGVKIIGTGADSSKITGGIWLHKGSTVRIEGFTISSAASTDTANGVIYQKTDGFADFYYSVNDLSIVNCVIEATTDKAAKSIAGIYGNGKLGGNLYIFGNTFKSIKKGLVFHNTPKGSDKTVSYVKKLDFNKNSIVGAEGSVEFHGLTGYPIEECNFYNNHFTGVSTMISSAGLVVSECTKVVMIGNFFGAYGKKAGALGTPAVQMWSETAWSLLGRFNRW
jgi:hypothetical protein